ncbi:RNA polymerase subunit sigma-70 [Halioglobus japonicus]|uniref:RNA polymerase sigma factor n=1 Tax=Halioglobus japonicus TaxID=930805 RepID=A0AAP8MF39_9GAMM|nr:sigma-70 family RNA polymerase sigma factor [Halioglobus japonicus]AQA18576.1 RNA polymerase subunit sigma-70 [Halioglobus japonicus]PLW86600.1 RNA polymerase subunit sigma-70 [Halioglobus japonicus]GHD12039.1 RNA polymerase sigma factor [Halioglobus japonicus]
MASSIGIDSTGRRDDEWSQCLQLVADNQDREAFSRLFGHFAPLIKAFAINGSALAAAHAEELVQEVMIKVWQKASAFNPHKAAASTWIYTIARNCRTDMYRRLQKFDTPLSADDIWPDSETDTEELFTAVQQKRDEAKVRDMLQQLPHEQSLILTKVYMEGKSHSEVSEELDLPLGTVKSRVRLAMKKLQLTAERH